MLRARRRGRPGPAGSARQGGLAFYVLWALREPPRRLGSHSSQMGFQAWLPLPLPKQLVVFGLGDWSCYSPDTSIAVDVLVSPGVAPQRVGTLEPTRRSLVWEDEWRTDLFMASLKEMDKGNPVRLVLTVHGQLLRGVSSSTPVHPFLVPETSQSPVLPADNRPLGQDLENPSGVKSQSSEVAARASRPVKKDVWPLLRTVVVPCALKSPAGKVESSEVWRKSPDQGPPRFLSKKPRKVLFEPTASERDLDEEDLAVKELQGSPSPRWCHAMCLSDLGTAVLIGGEGVNQQACRDALWKLEIDSDLWLPVGFQLQNAMPSCLHGHTATYDPDTKRIYIFGGIREDKDYGSIYILDTVTWKWLLVAAKGRIPVLTYHSATIYHKELFVFGGTFPRKTSLAVAPCSNVLYVFNPEDEIWYQPISEGEKPLPRLGHSATLLKNKLVIFGGQRTSVYFSDMHILDLGFMEYTSVPLLAGQPSARCFHAALAVSDQKVLISGGCNARGALHDAFVFHLDTLSWSTVIHHDLCSVPRAGHTLLDLTPTHLMDMDKENKEEQKLHTVLVFGGSNCAGTFYNSTLKIQLDLG
ncbi:rab9 effector protein with kelch motifs-like [Pyrgilauda ruficollis]|uniref:rab9 effector protein with kelch motifs-like n=2 Tax=Passeridae TaxID=9158 RepID=UPI001B8785A9|nr:rab9 effector protein with kelch motifs-like [Pyrgilauda ruficollis]